MPEPGWRAEPAMLTDDRPAVPRAWRVSAALAAMAIAGVVLVANAPANWLALELARATGGVVLLADAQGTIWSGSAVLALGAPMSDAPTAPGGAVTDGNSSAPVERLALPGRVTWTLEMTHALAPVLHLTHDGVLLQPLAVRYVDGGVSLDPGSALLPAALLRLAGAPLNTLLPEGRCTLRWNALRVGRAGVPVGEGTLRVEGFSLALSPVRPLGDYLVTWASGPTGLTWQLATEHGPLAAEGSGSVLGSRVQARVVLRPAADAGPAVAAQLDPLLDTIGRRGRGDALIVVGGP